MLPLAFIVGAVVMARWMVRNSPRARRRRRHHKRRARLVEVNKLRRVSHAVQVSAMGTVMPANKVTLQPQVAGRIVYLAKSLIPGGFVKKGEKLFRIESSEYWFAVKQQMSAVATAKAQLAQEKGRQAVAAKEYELLGKKVSGGDRDLMLRKPQLDAAKAAVAKAKAALANARLNLGRTLIRAPFNAVVETRSVNVGSRVTAGTPLATLVGTDFYWIEALVPVDQLRWLRFPGGEKGKQTGSQVGVRDPKAWGEKKKREGRVLRLLPGLEEKGRMARVLVEVPDPLAQGEGMEGKPRLLMGSYVSLEIEAGELKSVLVLDRKHLRDGDTVWVRDAQGKLDIRKVTVAFRGRDRVYLSAGVRPGEEVVVSSLSGPVQGMPLRTTTQRKGQREGKGESAGNRERKSRETAGTRESHRAAQRHRGRP